jgi:GldM N-terminal domain
MDPATSTKAAIWQPKAMMIGKLSKVIINYIDSLKTQLKEEAGLTEQGTFQEDNINAVNRFFGKNTRGEELYSKLIKYKQDVFAIDLLISNTFEKIITITVNEVTEKADGEKIFTKTAFTEIPTVAALAMLTKFQNNIRITENRTIMFCFEQITSYHHSHEIISAIVSLNSSYLQEGEEVQVTAGIGFFTGYYIKPEVIVNDKKIPINESGVAISKFKAIGKPGKHFIPVQISYIDQDGSKQTITKTVEYTIAKE